MTATTSARRSRSPQVGVHAGLVVLVAISLAPYLFMLVTSFKTNQQYNESFWLPTLPLHPENYAAAFEQVAPYLLNSVIVAGVSVAGIVLMSLVAGFVFSRFRFPGRNALFALIAGLMMVPSIASLIPLFVMMRDFDLLDTYAVLILPQVATGAILGIILMRNYIDGMPESLFEAASLDGAGPLRLWASILLPLSLPVAGTVALITVQAVWNDFFWPLLTISDDGLRTASVGLQFFQGQSATAFGPLFAGYLIASLPLVVLFTIFSRYFLAGMQGGVPGSH